MFYVVRNHSANQAYSVHLNTFHEKFEHLFNELPFINVTQNIQVKPTDNNSNVRIKIYFKLDNGFSYSDVVKKLNNEIEKISISLIDTKPSNIQLIYEGSNN